ncbi:MAG: PH domain-containing protein [Parvularculaceae bacterium]
MAGIGNVGNASPADLKVNAGPEDGPGYVVKTLASDETITYRVRFNWTFSFFPVLWFALGSTPMVMHLALQFGADIPFSELRSGWWASIVAIAFGSLILINHIIILVTTEIVVTNFRFVYKRGLIARHTQEVSLGKIEEITLNQSIWGRIFGYGKLVIRGTGAGVITLPNIDNPIEVRQKIESARATLRRAGGDN